MMEFQSGAALRAHYASVHDRLWTARKVVPAPPPQPPTITCELPARFQSQWEVNALTQQLSVRYGCDDDENAPAMRDILRAVATHYRVSVVHIKSHRRTANLVLPRHVAYYLCKTLTGRSLPEIGRHVGDKDHTTVLHGVRKIAAQLQTDARLAADIRAIQALLGRS